MKLYEIQQTIVERLTGAASLGGAPVLAEDGTYPKTPGREEALAAQGLVIIVLLPVLDNALDIEPDSGIFYYAHSDVVIEENQQICRTTGINIRYELALELVMDRVNGTYEGSGGSQQAFMPGDPPGILFGKTQGINRAVAIFTKLMQRQPDLSP